MIRDVMESAGLEGFAEIGLIIFVIAFLLVVLRVFFLNKEKADERSRLPLDDKDGATDQ